MNRCSIGLLWILVIALWAGPAPGRCDDHGSDHKGGREQTHLRHWSDGDQDHDRARRAIEQGEILPLAEIFARARARFPGRVLETELDREHGLWVYELKILDPQGRLFEVSVDARSGDILEYERED